MAGHSQFKNIMYRKGAQDAKRSRLFSRLVREVMVAARANADPASNPRLRTAIEAAREANMPKENLERAIKKGSGEDGGVVYEEVRYEGYGPGGIAIIVEGSTDNRNRTASDIRTMFSKNGGNLGESNSVTFMFKHAGEITYPARIGLDQVFEAALELGADDVQGDEEVISVICASADLASLRDGLEAKFGTPASAKLVWLPLTAAPLAGDSAAQALKLLDQLDGYDDVQDVYTNAEFAE
ncbi:MAG: YebC/PmpR family DNA-binding transcriptional regulator [Alphaproteobacteria bacterium]|nr:YebC/PmpR family DNA-binding transcriptional regulator [Alphaproteobacteria bacterium]